MRRWLLPISLLCFACRGAESPSAKCDKQKLIELGEALAKASESEQIATVWPGLEAACGDELPSPMRSFYQPPVERIPAHVARPKELAAEFEPLLLAACPTWTELGAQIVDDAPGDQRAVAAYRACSFEHFDVVDENDLGGTASLMASWAMHRWLLDQGLEPAQAKPITRALMSLEGRVTALVQPVAGLTWPTARGVALSDGFVVYVTRDEIGFDGRAVLAVDLEKELERSLNEAKQEFEPLGEAWMAPLIIAADATTPFATIMDLLRTGDQVGFEEVALVVDTGPDGLARLPISLLPKPEPTGGGKSGLYRIRGPKGAIPSMTREAMTIEITAQGLSLASEFGPAPELTSANDHAALTKYAQAAKRGDPHTRRVAISAEATTSVQTLASVIAAVRGPECTNAYEDDGCLLPEVFVLSEPAHELGKHNEPHNEVDDSDEAKPIVVGDLDPGIIRRIVRAHVNEVNSCYEDGLSKDPNLAGRVTIDFVIAASGKVRSSVVANNELSDASVAKCLAKAVGRWTFPKSPGEVKVSYPFVLDSTILPAPATDP